MIIIGSPSRSCDPVLAASNDYDCIATTRFVSIVQYQRDILQSRSPSDGFIALYSGTSYQGSLATVSTGDSTTRCTFIARWSAVTVGSVEYHSALHWSIVEVMDRNNNRNIDKKNAAYLLTNNHIVVDISYCHTYLIIYVDYYLSLQSKQADA